MAEMSISETVSTKYERTATLASRVLRQRINDTPLANHEPRSRMRKSRTSGSLGGLGGDAQADPTERSPIRLAPQRAVFVVRAIFAGSRWVEGADGPL